MSEIVIQATERQAVGAHSPQAIRQQGQVPGVIYGHRVPAQSIQLEARGLQEILQHVSSSTIVKLSLGGGTPQNVMIKEVQYDALSRRVRHIDFQAINMSEEVHVAIPVHLHGDAPGVKDGGVLQIGVREIEVRALPGDLPESIVVDISRLSFGHQIKVSDLDFPTGVEVVSDPEQLIAGISASNTSSTEIPETEIIADGPAKATAGEKTHPEL